MESWQFLRQSEIREYDAAELGKEMARPADSD